MFNIQIAEHVRLEMDTERHVPGIADGIAVLKTANSVFSCPFKLIVNSDDHIEVNPSDILTGVEKALVTQGLGVKVASIKVAARG